MRRRYITGQPFMFQYVPAVSGLSSSAGSAGGGDGRPLVRRSLVTPVRSSLSGFARSFARSLRCSNKLEARGKLRGIRTPGGLVVYRYTV